MAADNHDEPDRVAETSDEDPRVDGDDGSAMIGETAVETGAQAPAHGEMLSWDEVKQRENAKRQATKFLKLKYPGGGVAVFEYQMLEDFGQIARKHMTERPTRSGAEPRREMTDDQEWAFAAEVLGEALVDAPDGFRATEREIREGLTKPVVDEMVEAIADFSQMDEETFIKFR